MTDPKQESSFERRYDLDRTMMFSDGVFAIAITLLVLSIGSIKLEGSVSHQFSQLWHGKETDFFVYFLSFAVIAKFWLAHHRMFGYISRVDSTLIGVNLFYLCFIVLTPFSTELLGDNSGSPVAVAVYAANLTLVGIASSLMWRVARTNGLLVTERMPAGVRDLQQLLLFVPWVIFALSIPIALLISPSLAEWSWVLVFFAQPQFLSRFVNRPTASS